MRFLLALMGGLLLPSAAVYGAAFTLEFTGTISDAQTPGISVGDIVTLDLTVDNGGSTNISQTWNLADLQAFTIHAGTYSATYSLVFENPTTGNFVTDASGNLVSVQFYGTSNSSQNSDNFTPSFSGDYVAGNGQFQDSLFNNNIVVGDTWNNAQQWQVLSASSVPEPGTVGLFAFGLIGLAAVRRIKA